MKTYSNMKVLVLAATVLSASVHANAVRADTQVLPDGTIVIDDGSGKGLVIGPDAFNPGRNWVVPGTKKPIVDPNTGAVLGYEWWGLDGKKHQDLTTPNGTIIRFGRGGAQLRGRRSTSGRSAGNSTNRRGGPRHGLTTPRYGRPGSVQPKFVPRQGAAMGRPLMPRYGRSSVVRPLRSYYPGSHR